MLVHSFSPTDKWFAEYCEFSHLFGIDSEKKTFLERPKGPEMVCRCILGGYVVASAICQP